MGESKTLLNERIAGVPPSLTLSLVTRAKQMAAAGRRVISFAAGEPDFDTAQPIKDAAAAALAAGKTKYGPTAGLPELREAIARKLREENGLAYGADQVVVSNGAKHSIFNLILAVCRPGDRIVMLSPYWVSYPEMVRIAGGEPVFVAGAEADGFKVTPRALEAAMGSDTKAVILNSPSNPTGLVYDRDEILALAEVIVGRGAMLVSDEIYEKLVFDGRTHTSPGALSDEILAATVTVNGFSKAWAMTGWRLGYLAGPAEVVRAVSTLQSHSTSGANTFAQYGAVAALNGSEASQHQMLDVFAERRAYLYGGLTAIPGVTCVKPGGAFYMYPNISAVGLDPVTFATRLLDEEGVAVVPGTAFGTDAHVRLSYACGLDDLREGLDAIEAFIGKNRR